MRPVCRFVATRALFRAQPSDADNGAVGKGCLTAGSKQTPEAVALLAKMGGGAVKALRRSGALV